MIRYVLGKIAGEGFNTKLLPLHALVQAFFVQKLIGFNRGVSWPVHPTSRIADPDKINRGSRFPGLSMGCHLDGRNGIIFGQNVWVGPRVSIISMNHDISDFTKYVPSDAVHIGDNCWIGANAVILSEVRLGDHTIVGAGAVVTKSFPKGNCVIAGVPAKIVSEIGEYTGT